MTIRKPHVEEDDLTEILFMKTDRVDLVGGPANGADFLLAKSTTDPSLFSPEFVTELAKSAQEGDMTTKTAPDEELIKDVLDPEEIAETPEVDATGDPDDPASPAWEAADAVRAAQALDLTVALKMIVEKAQAREAQEALVGDDPDDADNVWDLDVVLDAIDCILGVLAPFAVTEQAEADGREVDDTVILKSGRVLSGTNFSNIQQAIGLLENVVATATPEVIAKSEDELLEKADDKAQQMLVYGPKGAVDGPLGSIDPADLTTFVNSADPEDAPADATADAPADDTAPTDDAAAAADAAPDAPADPADGETIPGTNTVQAPAEDDTEDVKKGLVADFQTALTEALEPIAKQLGAIPELATMFEDLQKRVDDFGKQPDDRRSPRLSGAVGSGFVDRAAEPVDKLAELRKSVEEAEPGKKVEAQAALAYASIRERFGK